jgi:hypothetical protein
MYNMPIGGGALTVDSFRSFFAQATRGQMLNRIGELAAQPIQSCLMHYELSVDTLVTHPLFEYRVSYRRLLEIQVRLRALVLEDEIGTRFLLPVRRRQLAVSGRQW